MAVVKRIAGLQLMLAMLALAGMGVVTVADVFLKYVFSRPVTGAYDLVESLLPVVIFHGLPATLLRRQNIAIDLIDHVSPPGFIRFLVMAADVVMLAVLAMFTWSMIGPALQALDYGDRKLELGLPLIVVWSAAILGMIGSVLVMATLTLRPVALQPGKPA